MIIFVKCLVIFSFLLVAAFAVDFDSDSEESFGSDQDYAYCGSKSEKQFNSSFSCGMPTESFETVKHHLSSYENRPMRALFNGVSFFFE